MRRALLFVMVLLGGLSIRMQAQTFNYGDALQKSIYFYECQRSGTMPANNRVNWKGNSGLNDGSDVSKNLTGGWYDAGDNVKFNFPMAFTATMLAWGAIENKDGYVKTGQYDKIKEALRWANDYFIKCHTAPNELYGQVGNGGLDHAFWGAAEIMQMARPSYKIDASKPGTDLAAETAAAMAAASIVFANDDPAYSALLLTHAKQLYTFADTYRGKYSDAISDAVAYYNSWSGYQDELVWGATWLYKATNETAFLSKAETEYTKLSTESGGTDKSYKWTTAWDDKGMACYVLLAKLTGKAVYKADAERFLDYWTVGYNGNKIKYTPGGLAWLDTWGSLRYSANTSFLAMAYSGTATTAAKGQTYYNFGLRQINYMLGDNPGKRSFMVGFGVNPPKNPHHRTAHGTWTNNLAGEPADNRHIICGALVGGPGNDDSYVDDRSNYTTNEIACDYNAAFTGALARLANDFGGVPSVIPVETPTDEYYCDAKINMSGSNFFEPAVFLNNHTAWPARMPANLSFRYFFDISEGIAAGKTIANYSLVSNYCQGGTVSTSFKQWAGSVYYVEVSFANQLIYPGGQSESKRETQFRIYGPAGAWDVTNDPSAQGLTSVLTKSNVICVYENGVLVTGTEPKGGVVIPVTDILLSSATLALNPGASSLLTTTVNPTNATNKAVTYTSSNPAVATVSATGLVTSVAVGTATITATSVSGSKTATCLVTVSNIGVVSVSLAPSTVTINKGEISQLTASILPTNATNKAVTYTTSNPAVATVSATGLINGMGQGTATITVTTTDGNKIATTGVTVTDIVIAVSGVSLSPASLSLNVGQASQLTASVLPTNANNKSVTYTSSNPAVLSVSATGLVTALANGTASVTVKTTDGNFTAVCAVNVTTPTTTKNFLSTANGKLYDAAGNQVRLTGVNWFGFETAQLAPHGLWSRDFKSMLMQMKDVGFNCVRLPWTNAMLRPGKTIQINSYGSDSYTQRSPMNAVESTFTTPLQLLDQIIKYAQELDLKIILDCHARQADNYLAETIWYDNTCTEQQWIDDWTFLVKRYKDYDSFIACDLDNEPHGNATWGTSSPATDWNKAAERCGNAILTENPNMLIFVEGIEFYKGAGYWWGGNFLGAKSDPVVLSKPSQLVYSPHEYGPTVFAQTWFNDPTFPANMPAIWDNNFGYLQNSGTSHLFVGEFGIKTFGGKDEVWIREFLKYMGNSYSWTFWCWNPNSGDTGGILDDQWTNLVTAKVDLLKPYMAPIIPNGKVGQLVAVTSVGLDQTSLALTSIGQTAQLTATVLPSNASDKSVSYTSSNPAAASVSASGLITSIATGSTVITVKTTDGGKTATCNVTVSVSTISVTSVSLTPASVSINKGASAQLTAAVLPVNATNKAVNYTSSNANVATVSSTGLVSGLSQGTAIITVTTVDGAKTAACNVTVTDIVTHVTSVSVSPASLALSVAQTSSLAASVLPANASDVTVSWSSSNTAVASVSASGVVTAVAPGTANITVTTTDGGFKAVCAVNVSAVAVTGISVSPTSLSIVKGNTSPLTSTISPANATNKNVTYTSSNPAIATVSATGVVTAVSAGSATVSVKSVDGNFAATCAVSVSDAPAFSVKIEAESFNGKSASPKSETCSEGGLDMGWINTSDWMTFAVNIPTTGVYTVNFRVASPNSNAQLRLDANAGATVFGTANIPNTGGWQNWQTVSVQMTLNGGSYNLGLNALTGGFNVNWIEIVGGSTAPIRVTGISMAATASVGVGATSTLTATVAPSNASNKNVSWSSSNTAVASVSASGVVTGVSAGTATITATTLDGGFSANCAVTVAVASCPTWKANTNYAIGTVVVYNGQNYTSNNDWNGTAGDPYTATHNLSGWGWVIGGNCTKSAAVSSEAVEAVEASLVIFPNPVEDQLQVQSSVANINEVSIFSLTGSLIHRHLLSSVDLYSVNLSDLSSGVYVIRIVTLNETINRKFIKK